MSTIHKLVYILITAMLLLSGCASKATEKPLTVNAAAAATVAAPLPPTATPEPTQEADPELLAALAQCDNIFTGQACLVEGPVMVTAQPERFLMPFSEPGQTINLADLQTLKLGTAGSNKGIVMMRIQTEWAEGYFTAVVFGDVELVNEVPYGTSEFFPMQSMSLTTGVYEEGQEPIGLLVASPDDGNLSTLVVNGLEMSFGSGGWLTSQGGGLSIQTLWGTIGTWVQDRIVQVKTGFGMSLTHDEIERGVEKTPYSNTHYQRTSLALKKYFGNNENDSSSRPNQGGGYKPFSETLKRYFGCKDWLTNPGCRNKDDEVAVERRMRDRVERRRQQTEWLGGWWKMTYGPTTSTGVCDGVVVADGYDGGSSDPYTTEIPMCRGNNGNTILMYESGTRYDQISPNLYASSYLTEIDLMGNGNVTTEGRFSLLQVISPTRIVLSNANSDDDSCTTASTAYLEFLRDDPNIRCGYVVDIGYFSTPEPPTPVPTPESVDPPRTEPYQVRLGILSMTCDPNAQQFAPDFDTVNLSLSAENQLMVEADMNQYKLQPSNLTYDFQYIDWERSEIRLGYYSVEQPMDSTFKLMLSLVLHPGQRWLGVWLVANQDASQTCGGSIDLFPPE